jgi:hypothetical protein
MFACESARLFVSTPSNPPIHFSCVRKKNNRGIYFWGKISKCGCRPLIVQSHFLQFHSVDKLTQQQPKWNCRPIAWTRPLPRRPFVSRLDAKPNYNKSHRPLWCEWIGRCPLTQSIRKKDKFIKTRPIQWITTIYLHPSVVRTNGQTFRPFVPCQIIYPTLNEITEKIKLSRMCNDTSMGKQNSRLHVGIVWQFLRKLSIRQFPKFQFPLLLISRERLESQRSTGNSWSFSHVRLCRNEMTVCRQGRNWITKLFHLRSKKKNKLKLG